MEKKLIDHLTMSRTLRRLSYEIIEKNENLDNIVLLGIMTKGVVLSEIIGSNIEKIEGVKTPVFPLDITPFRDDLTTDIPKTVNDNVVTVDLSGKHVVLVDDVLYTGRTVRAAMDAVIKLGRPSKIELAVLIDRGHRQFPIKANYIGKNIPTSSDETIKVFVTDLSEDDKVIIIK